MDKDLRVHLPRSIKTIWLYVGVLLLAGTSFGIDCNPPEPSMDMGMIEPPDLPSIPLPDLAPVEDPPLDPRGLFEAQVKPELVKSCSCHYTQQDLLDPFMAMGSEYATLTAYQGGKYLTTIADQSLLLQRGAHVGPAFTFSQRDKVLGWLQGESLQRGKSGGSMATPSVALRSGNFYISLESLAMDPLAHIRFTLSEFGVRSYRVTNLSLTAGPTAGIHIKHPRFIIYSANAAAEDPSDALSTVDASTMNPSQRIPIGTGSLLLSNLPAVSARIALVFEQIDRVNVNTTVVQCRNYSLFDFGVKGRLASCATQCHSASGSDPRWSQASTAFDMSAALGTDSMSLQRLCARALGRLELSNLAQSVLILQPQPSALGGLTNHPFKLTTPAQDFAGWKSAVTSWGMGE